MMIRWFKRRLQVARARRVERERMRGYREGAAEVLQRQLELKFGPLPGSCMARLREADDHLLLRWSERVLMAVSLSAVFEGMNDGLAG